jgi:hypothetical protein
VKENKVKALSVFSFEDIDNKIYYTQFFVCGKCELVEVETDEEGHADLCQDCLHDAGQPCKEEKCQECCPHDERDHGICLDCEHEEDPGEAIDRAMDYYEGDR